MKITLITLALVLSSAFAFASEYNCEQKEGGSHTLVLQTQSDFRDGDKTPTKILIKDGAGKIIFNASGSAYTEDVVVNFNAKSGKNKVSGTLYLDELDQTSVTLKKGKKSRKNFDFDCNPED